MASTEPILALMNEGWPFLPKKIMKVGPNDLVMGQTDSLSNFLVNE